MLATSRCSRRNGQTGFDVATPHIVCGKALRSFCMPQSRGPSFFIRHARIVHVTGSGKNSTDVRLGRLSIYQVFFKAIIGFRSMLFVISWYYFQEFIPMFQYFMTNFNSGGRNIKAIWEKGKEEK